MTSSEINDKYMVKSSVFVTNCQVTDPCFSQVVSGNRSHITSCQVFKILSTNKPIFLYYILAAIVFSVNHSILNY